MAKPILQQPHSRNINQTPVGYTLTTLFFPPLPALIRGDINLFIIQLILAGFLIPILIFPRIYNTQYIQKLLSNGYKVRSTEGISLEAAKAKLGINLPTMDDADA